MTATLRGRAKRTSAKRPQQSNVSDSVVTTYFFTVIISMKYFNRVFSLIKLKYLLLKMTRNPLYFSKLFVHLRIQFVTPDCD